MNKANTTYLTRRQAWKKIQAAFKIYATTGKAPYMAFAGLCHAVGVLFDACEITEAAVLQMGREIRSVKPKTCLSLWYWPTSTYASGTGQQGAAYRVKAINQILRKK